MQEDMKSFLRLLCTISATMASVSFVGVSVILTIYLEIQQSSPDVIKEAWLRAANTGMVSVAFFAFTSFAILFYLFPKTKEEKTAPSVVTQWMLKRKRLLKIATLEQRVTASIKGWFKENVTDFLLGVFTLSWLVFFLLMVFLFNAFQV